MPLGNTSQADVIRRFWDRYINFIKKQGVKDSYARWYVIRVEHYIKTYPTKRLIDHGPFEVASFFEIQGKSRTIMDWQFRQIVDAIQNLFIMLNVPWVSQVDWQYWMDSAKSLPETHATVAREIPAEHTIDKLSKVKGSRLSEIRRHHKETLTQLVVEIRRRGYAIKTEQTYESWISRFLAYSAPEDLTALEDTHIVSFLQHLAVRRNVAASTQNQALNALVFFYRHVLKKSIGDLGHFIRARRPRNIPVVLTRNEVQHLLNHMKGRSHLMASLIYGTGMRLMDCIRLRVKDIDFEYRQIVIRKGKGGKDRIVPLPECLSADLKRHLEEVGRLHQNDLRQGFGEVFLPQALARKYPNASKEWRWQYVFPGARLSADPRSGTIRRHHIHETGTGKSPLDSFPGIIDS